MYINKIKEFKISGKSLIYNPHTVMEFINKFYNEFNYEIVGVDASSEERTFKFQLMYLKDGIQKNVEITYDSFNAQLIYYLAVHNRNDLFDFEKVFTREVKYIEKFI